MRGSGDQTKRRETTRAKHLKRKFDSKLRHVKFILMKKRNTMSTEDWRVLVEETKKCIVKYPGDFLGPEVRRGKITRAAIHLVFEGFMKDMHIREVQSFRGAIAVTS